MVEQDGKRTTHLPPRLPQDDRTGPRNATSRLVPLPSLDWSHWFDLVDVVRGGAWPARDMVILRR